MQRDIAVVIQNYVQFINIKFGIEELLKRGYSVDIYCPKEKNKTGYSDMFNDIKDILKNLGYNVYDEIQNIKYKVLLEPYPYMPINAKYFIKYKYGCLSAKPDLTYLPKEFIKYDAILCSGNFDANYLDVYSQTYKIGNMKYINFKKKHIKKDKKILLYLPTYGDNCSIDYICDELANLRSKYYVITKIHHGTNFLKKEKSRIEKAKKCSDEFYDSHKDLADLLSIADIVLTDNSGAIFEAIYTNTPVVIFCEDVNKDKLDDFDTIQSELCEKEIVLWTNDSKKIDELIEKTLSPEIIERQKKWNNSNLYHPRNKISDFILVIEKFLNDDINDRHYKLHHILQNDYYTLCNENITKDNMINDLKEKNRKLENNILDFQKKIDQLNENIQSQNKIILDNKEQIVSLKKLLSYYDDGKLYKLAKKIYKFLRRG